MTIVQTLGFKLLFRQFEGGLMVTNYYGMGGKEWEDGRWRFCEHPQGMAKDNMSKYNQMLYMNLSSALVSTPLD